MIHTDSKFEEGHCGLVPFGEVCSSCTTSGLKWNLSTYVYNKLKFEHHRSDLSR